MPSVYADVQLAEPAENLPADPERPHDACGEIALPAPDRGEEEQPVAYGVQGDPISPAKIGRFNAMLAAFDLGKGTARLLALSELDEEENRTVRGVPGDVALDDDPQAIEPWLVWADLHHARADASGSVEALQLLGR